MAARNLIFFFAILLLPACGLFHEREAAAPLLKVKNPLDNCQLPNLSDFGDPKIVSEPMVKNAIDCVDKRLTTAFEKIHGAVAGEISVDEIRSLARNKIVDMGEDDDIKWKMFNRFVPLVHPDARPAVSQATVKKLIAFARRYYPLYVKAIKEDIFDHPKIWLLDPEPIQAYTDAVDFISSNFQISLREVQTTLREARDYAKTHKNHFTINVEEANTKIEALWILKGLVFEGIPGEGPRGPMLGLALKNLLNAGLESTRRAKLTIAWGHVNVKPWNIPVGLAEEWKSMAEPIRDYFLNRQFAYLESDLLAWSIRKLSPETGLADLAKDLVRISQRLAPNNAKYPGLHPAGLVAFLDAAPAIANDFIAAGSAYQPDTDNSVRELTVRQALAHPLLKRVAVKGVNYPDYSLDGGKQLRKDYRFSWETATSRLIDRQLVSIVFRAFDKDKDGKIALEGRTDEDVKEILDLAYTFLRFASVESHPQSPRDPGEEHVQSYVSVKPGPLSKVMGLIGDRWMPDGDHDGALNADEFFSVTKVYAEIQSRAQSMTSSLYQQIYYRPEDTWIDDSYYGYRGVNPVYPRKPFVTGLKNTLTYDLPKMHGIMESMPAGIMDSLFHSLVGSWPPDRQMPLDTYKGDQIKEAKLVSIDNYVGPDAAVGPAAIMVVLDRLMLLCDANENEKLEWNELDCAMPLILDGALETVNSGLVDLDPGVNDGSKLLLGFLKGKGIPITLAKLVAVNGSISEMSLTKEYPLVPQLFETQFSADWTKLAYFLGAPTDGSATPQALMAWKLEAKHRFEKCDIAPRNDRIEGRKEWACFVTEVSAEVIHTFETLAARETSGAGLERFLKVQESELIQLGIAVATQSQADIDAFFLKAGVASSPEKILRLLEEIVRRSLPL